ncbi:MAG: gliding motility-associated C-terminal domain-containing protein [Saprospiraceae bacterium]|nr:gliding motility-associated C-terminal domain-containing protein [Saprospiraceae bacterium]
MALNYCGLHNFSIYPVRRVLFLVFCCMPVVLSSQEIFLSTLDHRLYQLDLADCTYQQVGNVPQGSTDICFHPNSYLYSVSGNGRLFQVNIATGTGTLVHTFENTASQLYTSLAADANGVFYTCGLNGRLFSYNLATNTGTYLGNVGYAAEGDLTFYNGQLYMAASGDDIVRVDINNPGNSTIAVNGNVPGRIFGIVSYAETCDSVSSYAFTDNAANIYRVDYANAALVPYCNIPLSVSGGASMFEYLGSNPIDVAADASGFDCTAGNGVINITASGGIGLLSYSLDGQNYQINAGFSGLPVGDYTVYVQDEVGCIVSLEVDLGVDFPGIENLVVTPASCGENNGSISLSIAGGTAPYLLSANGGPASSNLNLQNLAPGSYQLAITDAVGCHLATTAQVTTNGAPAISGLEVTPTSCGENNGRIVATVQGGLAPVNYVLNGGNPQTTGNFMNLPPGNYTLDITDANGCALSETAVIAASQPVLLNDVVVKNASCGKANGTMTIFASGGQAPLEFSTDGDVFGLENAFTGLAAGDYEPTVMDAAGCTAALQRSITGTTPPRFGEFTVKPAECQEANGALMAAFEGGLGALTLTLNGEARVLDFPITGLAADDYVLLLGDSIGCMDTLAFVIPRINCPIYLPNAFSPNDDGINDRFRPEAIRDLEAQVVRFYVFDRWGGFVFKSENRAFSDPENGWNGRKNGKISGQGVYTWYLEVAFSDGGKVSMSGDVVLVR